MSKGIRRRTTTTTSMMIVPIKMATAMIMTEDHRKRLNSKQRSGFVKKKKNDNDSLRISSIDVNDYSDDGMIMTEVHRKRPNSNRDVGPVIIQLKLKISVQLQLQFESSSSGALNLISLVRLSQQPDYFSLYSDSCYIYLSCIFNLFFFIFRYESYLVNTLLG